MSNNTNAGYPAVAGDELVFENDRVRVWAMNLPANGMFDYHQHFHDHLIIWPDAGRAEAQDLGDDDWSVKQSAERGYVAFKTVGRDAPLIPHRIRNLEGHPVTHYIVEFISETSPSASAQPAQNNGRGTSSRPGAVILIPGENHGDPS